MRAPFFAVLLPKPACIECDPDAFTPVPGGVYPVCEAHSRPVQVLDGPFVIGDVADWFGYAQAYAASAPRMSDPVRCGRCGLALTTSRERGLVCMRCDFSDPPRRAA